MKKDNTKLILIILVVILTALVIYAFIVKPAFTSYATDLRNEGIDFTISSIVNAVSTCQQVPLSYKNLTVTLIAVECLQEINLVG